jgi:hypothetical protein
VFVGWEGGGGVEDGGGGIVGRWGWLELVEKKFIVGVGGPIVYIINIALKIYHSLQQKHLTFVW